MSAPESPNPRPPTSPTKGGAKVLAVIAVGWAITKAVEAGFDPHAAETLKPGLIELVVWLAAGVSVFLGKVLRNRGWKLGQILPTLLAAFGLAATLPSCAAIPLPGISQAAPVRETPATRYYAAQGAFNTAVAAATAFMNARRADGSPLVSSEAADQIVESAEVGRDLIRTTDALLDRCAPWIPNPETGETPVVAVLGEDAAPPPAECQDLEGTLAAARAELAAGAARVTSRTAAAGAAQ